MRRLNSVLTLFIAGNLAAVPASAETLEGASRRSFQDFSFIRNAPLKSFPKGRPDGAEGFDEVLAGQPVERSGGFQMTNVAAADLAAQSGRTPVDSVGLDQLHNRHLKATISETLSGETVRISGTFDREQNAFLTVWPDSAAGPKIFNIKGLLNAAGKVQAGGAAYEVYLEANPLKPLKSKITFENSANEDDLVSIRIGTLLDKVEAAGRLVPLTGQAYRLFYFDGVKEDSSGASLDPSQRTFAMILKEGDDMHVFLIPDETVPSDKIAVYTMHQNKRVGLRKNGGVLEIYENP